MRAPTCQPGIEFLTESRRFLLEEFLPKIEAVVERLDDEQIWWRGREESNSIGNLILHLAGNLRQWIVCGIGGRDERVRQQEFEEREKKPREELLAKLRGVVEESARVLDDLDAERLLEKRIIQGRDVTVLAAVYHVVEHFAMHAGQIIFVAKIFSGDLAFYENADGLAIPQWKKPATE